MDIEITLTKTGAIEGIAASPRGKLLQRMDSRDRA
jgi:hypothetical protein